MKKMKQNKKAIIIEIICIVTIIGFILAMTSAYFTELEKFDSGVDVGSEVGDSDKLIFSTGRPISLNPNINNFGKNKGDLKESSNITATLLANRATKYAKANYNVFLVITKNEFDYTTNEKTPEIILTVKDPNDNVVSQIEGLKQIEEGFDITRSQGTFKLASDYDIETASETAQTWKIEVTMVNLNEKQNANFGKGFTGQVYVTKEDLSTYISPEIKTASVKVSGSKATVTPDIKEGSKKIVKYFYAIREEGSNEVFKYQESTDKSYTFGNLKNDTNYEISIYVEDTEGIKSNVYEAGFNTGTTEAPVVSGVKVQSELFSATVEVESNATNGKIVKYYYSIDGGRTFVETTDSSYTFENLQDTSNYDVVVKVEDEFGNVSAPYREEVETKTYVYPSVTRVDSTSTWNSVTVSSEGEDGSYPIDHYEYSLNGAAYQELPKNYTFEGLNEKETYHLRVKAVDTLGRESSPYSLDVITDAYKLPKVAITTTSSTENSITINTSATNGDGTIAKYMYSNNDGGSWVEVKDTKLTNQKVFEGLSSNTVFHVQVKVVDNNGRESTVAKADIKTKYINPTVKLAFTDATENSISVSATGKAGSTPISKYEYSLDGSSWLLGTGNANTNNYTFTELGNTGNYVLHVRLTDEEGITAEATTTYTAPIINDIKITYSYSHITVVANAIKGTGAIEGYCFKVNNGSCQNATKMDETSGTYTFEYDVSDIEKEFTLSVNAIDEYNRISNVKTGSVTVPKYTKPKVALEITDASLTGMTVRANIEAGSTAITKYEFSKDNQTWVDNKDKDTYKLKDLEKNHEQIVYVRVTDERGVQATASIQYKNPVLNLEVESATKDSFKVKTTVTAGTKNPSKFEYSTNNKDWVVSRGNDKTNTYTFNDLPDKENTLYVRVTDVAGHTASTKLTYVDPKVNLSVTGATTTSITVNTTKSAGTSDLAKFEYSKDNKTWVNNETANYTFSDLEETTNYTLYVKATDSKGRIATATTTYLNPTASDIKITNTYNSVTVSITGAKKTYDLGLYYFSLDGTTWKTSETNSYTFSHSINTESDTTYSNIKAYVADTFGRKSTTLTGTTTIPKYVKPTVKLEITAADLTTMTVKATQTNTSTTAITKYEFSNDNQTWTNNETTATYKLTGYPSNHEGTGYVKVTDEAGQTATASVKYQNPTVVLSIKSATANSFTTSATGTKGSLNISKYEYKANSAISWTTNEGTSTTNEYTFSNLTDHTNTLNVQITDAGGHFSTNAITYTDPSVTLNFTSGAITATSIGVTATGTAGKMGSTNQNITLYEFSSNNTNWTANSTNNTYNFTSLVATSNYTFYVRVTDAKGRQNTNSVTYTNPVATKIEISSITNGTTLVAKTTAVKGTGALKTYYFRTDEDAWQNVASNTTTGSITLSNINKNKLFSIKGYVEDENGRRSAEVSVSITQVTVNFNANGNTVSKTKESCFIKSGEQNCTITTAKITPNTKTPNLIGFSESATDHSKVIGSEEEFTLTTTHNGKTYYAQSQTFEITRSVAYTLGTGIASTNPTSSSCKIGATYNGEGQGTSCEVTLATITASSGYEVDGYYSGTSRVANSGAKATISGNVTYKAAAKPRATNVEVIEAKWDSLTVRIDAEVTNNALKTYYCSANNGNSYSTSTSNVCKMTGLNEDTNYNIRVYVKDTGGIKSNELTTTGKTTAYVYPTVKITNAVIGDTTIQLSVTATQGQVDGQNVPIKNYIYYQENTTKQTTASSQLTNSYTFTGLTPEATYQLKVQVTDNNNKVSVIDSDDYTTYITMADKVVKLGSYDGANNIYHHDGFEDGAGGEGSNYTANNEAKDGSYRYAGSSSSVNNYVCFNSDLSTCPTNNLYRIIGVFDGQIKLIKSEYATSTELGTNGNYAGIYNYTNSNYRGDNPLSGVASYYWVGTRGSTASQNYWKNSDLNKINLNDYYLNTYLGAKWRNMIVDHSYQVGGYSETNSAGTAMVVTTVKNYYTYEVKNSKEALTAKIGLMYISDYGYAADYNYWSAYAFDPRIDSGAAGAGTDLRYAIDKNWMFMGLTEFSITRDTSITVNGLSLTVLGPTWKGQVRASQMWQGNSGNLFTVRPVFYLNSNVLKYSGTGTKSDPYRLSQEISDPPTVSIASTTSTSSSITLTVNGTSGTNPIANYKYYLNGALKTTQSSNSYTFSGLAPYTTYTVSAEAVDSDGNVSSSVANQVTTKMLNETFGSTRVASSSGAYCYSCMSTSCKWAQGGTTVVVLWGDYYNMRQVNSDWYQVYDKWGDKGSDKGTVTCYVQACKISGSC